MLYRGRVTSGNGMVFMRNSDRAAELANNSDLDVGLHLNFPKNLRLRGFGTTSRVPQLNSQILEAEQVRSILV
jgi:predicted glycoside hydrolase/deacetylase ChbG (UPF0249 family)